VDHDWKKGRVERAEVMEWSCKHRGKRCGGPSSAGIEERWNERERGYVIAIFVLGTAGLGLLGAGRLRSPR
jgi:hypothetical protein